MAKISQLPESARQLQALMLDGLLDKIADLESQLTAAKQRITELEATPEWLEHLSNFQSWILLERGSKGWEVRLPWITAEYFPSLSFALRYANAEIKKQEAGE